MPLFSPFFNEGLKPTWGIQPRLFILVSTKSNIESRLRVYPLISTSAAWLWGSGLVYTGFDFVVPFTRPDYDKEAPHIIFSPFLGYRWKLSDNLRLFTELKWNGANIQSDQLAVEYMNIGGYGAVAILFAIERRF